MLSSATITRPPLLPLLGILGILILLIGLPESARGTDIDVPSGQPELPPDINPPSSSPASLANPARPVPVAPPIALHKVLFGDKLFLLPANLTLHQQRIAFGIIAESESRLIVLHTQLRDTLNALHNLSFDSDTPIDALPVLGRELIRLRGELLKELQNISLQLEKKAGFNPGWGARRTGSLHHPASCSVCAKEREQERRKNENFRELPEQLQPENKAFPEASPQNGTLQVEQRVLEQKKSVMEPCIPTEAPQESKRADENGNNASALPSALPATP